MKIIENNILPPKGYKAITLLNLIFVRKGTELNEVDINHEAIHWKQEKELLIVGFYILYVLFFFIRLVQYAITGYRLMWRGYKKFGLWKTAYRKNPFEQEAYCYQNYVDYLKHRKHYDWRYFIKK